MAYEVVTSLFTSKCHFTQKRPFCFIWGLGATYNVHLRLTGKRVLDFLLVVIELFC